MQHCNQANEAKKAEAGLEQERKLRPALILAVCKALTGGLQHPDPGKEETLTLWLLWDGAQPIQADAVLAADARCAAAEGMQWDGPNDEWQLQEQLGRPRNVHTNLPEQETGKLSSGAGQEGMLAAGCKGRWKCSSMSLCVVREGQWGNRESSRPQITSPKMGTMSTALARGEAEMLPRLPVRSLTFREYSTWMMRHWRMDGATGGIFSARPCHTSRLPAAMESPAMLVTTSFFCFLVPRATKV